MAERPLHPSSTLSLSQRATSPGILRLYLASAVVWEHVMGGGLGTLSVYLFFVLSGYWISMLWKTKYSRCKWPYLVFMISRYWRLLPIYLVSVLLSTLSLWRFSRWWPSWAALYKSPLWLLNTFFIIGSAAQPHLLTIYWSLDIEVQFYFLAPLVIAMSSVFGRSALQSLLLVAACGFGYFFLPLMAWVGPYLVFFLAGCALERTRWNPPRWLVAVSAVLFVIAYVITVRLGIHFWDKSFNGTGYRLLPLCCVILALPYVALSLQRKSDRLDRILGDLAYPLYLFHFIPWLIIDPVIMLHTLPPFPKLILYLDVTLAGTAALYFFIDRPIDKRRREFVESRVKMGNMG
jgi:peptidoglycan/LPS O-acetylase OafA/YrhL